MSPEAASKYNDSLPTLFWSKNHFLQSHLIIPYRIIRRAVAKLVECNKLFQNLVVVLVYYIIKISKAGHKPQAKLIYTIKILFALNKLKFWFPTLRNAQFSLCSKLAYWLPVPIHLSAHPGQSWPCTRQVDHSSLSYRSTIKSSYLSTSNRALVINYNVQYYSQSDIIHSRKLEIKLWWEKNNNTTIHKSLKWSKRSSLDSVFHVR